MFHRFQNDIGEECGSFETFFMGKNSEYKDSDGESLPSGWYWYACFPGCLPDGEPSGPFKTESEAISNAQDEF